MKVKSGFGSPGQTITIGNIEVRRLGFGAMQLHPADAFGLPRDRTAAHAVLRRAVESGLNFIDTADAYGPNISEDLIAEALHPYPRDLVIATKGGYLRPTAERWDVDCTPKHLRAACEDSLMRLKLDCIDVYQLHCVDRKVPIEESIGALADLQRAGKIKHIGVCNVSAPQLAQARLAATIVSVQNHYNLEERASDALVETCEHEGMVFIPYFPLASGRLGHAGGKLEAVAKKYGATTAQVALAWLLKRSLTMLPIPGTSSISHLDENLGSVSLTLDHSDYAALSQA